MNNKVLLESMALDLKRVAIGAHSNSIKMTEKFLQEVLKRNKLLDYKTLPASLNKVLHHMNASLKDTNNAQLADNALMYSTLLLSFSKRI